MREARTPDPRGETPEGRDPAASEDDFLFHLYRGSDLLMQERVVEAKEELERALSMQPQDAKGQDLLAGVYFRLGVYPRAIETWQRLVDAYPRDATLRVNLALALLKTGQPAGALAHIHAALGLNPDHERAWGYLGLIQWRLGHHEEAREAFLRGGQASMARRMEEVLVTSAGAVLAPTDTQPEPEAEARGRVAMRSAAEQAIEQFEAEQLPLTVAGDATPGQRGGWRVAEPGEERIPSRPRAARHRPVDAPPALDALLDRWSLNLPSGTPLSLGSAGELFLSLREGDAHARLEGLRAVRGEMRTTVVQRRTRGRDLDAILGGDAPLFRWRGPVAAVLRAPPGRRFHGLTLDDDVLYLREELLWAFDGSLEYESGTLPQEGSEPLTMVQLYGSGTLALCLEDTPSAIRVSEGDDVRVDPAALVGWTGRLLPRGRLGGTQPYSLHAPPLSFRGDGVVLVA